MSDIVVSLLTVAEKRGPGISKTALAKRVILKFQAGRRRIQQ